MKDITKPTYDELHQVVTQIAGQLSDVDFDIIGIVARGGMLPGKILSHQLNLPTFTIYYSSQQGKGETHRQDQLPALSGKKILFVDEIADTGHTLKEIVDYYSVDNQVTTYTIYWRTTSVFKPDFQSVELDEQAGWIYLPWEV